MCERGHVPRPPGVHVPLRADVVHSLVRYGLWSRQQGLTTGHSASVESNAPSPLKRVTEVVREIEAAAGWVETPFLALHAVCRPPWKRPDDFYSENGFKGLMRDPPVLRRDGFHIHTWVAPELAPDGGLHSTTNRKVLWLSQYGMLSAAARADEEFLGWFVNSDRKAGESIALNPKCVTEYILEFSRFFQNHLKSRNTGDWTLFLSIVGFDRDGGVVLVPTLATEGHQMAPHWKQLHGAAYRAPTPRDDRQMGSGLSSGGDAYALVKELYAFFGQPPDQIPYVVNNEISATVIGS